MEQISQQWDIYHEGERLRQEEEARFEAMDSSSYHQLTGEECGIEGDTLVKVNTKEAFVTLPEGIQVVGACAFFQCTALKKVTLPDTFWECTTLQLDRLPPSVHTLGEGVFWDCDSFTEFTLPEALTVLPDGCFAKCDALNTVHLPKI